MEKNEKKEPTRLEKIRATNPVKPSADVAKVLKENLAKAEKQVADATAALEKSQSALNTAVAKLCEAVGGRPVNINGQVREFGCRGDLIFFKTRAELEVVDL